MDDHNIGEDVKATPKQKHNYEEPVLAQQIDQTSPEECFNQIKEKVSY